MNRELKFRVWDQYENKFSYSESHDNTCFLLRLGGQVVDGEGNSYKQDYPVQQYTGFKDKHGKEIYEGDWCFADNQRVIIIFKDGMFGYDTCLGMHCILISELIEVIGNKFEQEELIRIYETKEFYQNEKA